MMRCHFTLTRTVIIIIIIIKRQIIISVGKDMKKKNSLTLLLGT